MADFIKAATKEDGMDRQGIEAALAVVNKLIRAGQLTVIVETPGCSNCCPVVSANLNGNNIDLWLSEKFGNAEVE
mgnify:CR=1 FL=1